MVRLLFALGVVVVILTIYTLVDCALLQHSRVRGLPRWVWIFVIILIPVIGPVLWLLIGRGRTGAGRNGGRIVRSVAPDDDIDFLKGLDRAKSEQEHLRALEQELADLDKEIGTPDSRNPGGPGQTGAGGLEPKKSEPGEGDLPGRRDA
ncbi:hypothetical protein E3T26_04140 [Cryobacterium sp. TMT1-21]|uniref:Cardiolipin synthase N-terminal domain-containing protein n=1 Tax=Cryobacterium shii TaxID=1259235 RepID=A0AAQ2C5L5_9MICO|nr:MULTISPECIES: PLD nuclease N-terminal domain-containing protein [Cryobacterium]TFC45603.1 hypothetical protein E3O49_10550 [Cryobacterium shii]TFC85789.1 hypothetical protein E3T24_07675 [Cryobacterium sp. TmT2-59]TFD16470.1 hypothetical protein E3T26_04140 [Cryobacterium sp. TMT1-21]TFD16918.1 hypothetical protein E3T42_08380 [Cryobacterium sp. TMT4-10]TFD23594.1 hypothetical protein E3T32_05130 [Cryobacterium sp. TMT2-23]